MSVRRFFRGGEIDYVIVQPVPFAMDYSWNKLTILQLSDKEEIEIDEFYLPTSSGEREIRFRTIDRNIGLCMPSRGAFPWVVGGELRVPFKVYSWIEILMLIGAISAIVAAILSGIELLNLFSLLIPFIKVVR